MRSQPINVTWYNKPTITNCHASTPDPLLTAIAKELANQHSLPYSELACQPHALTITPIIIIDFASPKIARTQISIRYYRHRLHIATPSNLWLTKEHYPTAGERNYDIKTLDLQDIITDLGAIIANYLAQPHDTHELIWPGRK